MADTEPNEGVYYLPEEFLSDDFFPQSEEENSKTSVMGTSPQPTLFEIGNWSFSSKRSPNGPSRAPSQPSTPFPQPRDDALDLLYAAVGQVERLKLSEENPSKNSNNPGNFYPNQELIKQQLQAARLYRLKRQQLMKLQHQQYVNAAWERQRQSTANAVSSPRLSPSEWLSLQNKQPGSGMAAVFLNGSAWRQSSGTGVFLPRRIGTPTEPKKKQSGSTVLLPARVMQALNLNVEDMGVRHSQQMPGCYVLDNNNNDGFMGRINMKRNHRPHHHRQVVARSDICLPQEWTY